MAGAIAGTAILHAPEKVEGLHTVTLTVNNSCNLECPHCYLQYDGSGKSLTKDYADRVLESRFKHLAIVGKEPTLSPEIVSYLARENKARGRKTSMITNGHYLNNLGIEGVLPDFDYVDVSLDGGAKTYELRRRKPFKDLLKGLESAVNSGLREVNALHTLYSENIGFVEDMMEIEDHFPFNTVAFSPYKIPSSDGRVSVKRSSIIDEFLPALARNNRFRDNDNAIALISGQDMSFQEAEQFLDQVESLDLTEKVSYTPDPLERGFIRVTYDGLVLSPNDAIHTSLYLTEGEKLMDSRFKSLNDIFYEIAKRKMKESVAA